MELRETKLNLSGEDGYSNNAFEEEDIKDQSESRKYSLRYRNEHNGDSKNTQQGEEHVTIEQDLPKQKESIEENELIHRKGYLEKKYDVICNFFRKHKTVIQYIFYGIFLAGYLTLMIAACVVNFHRALPLFLLTIATIFFVIWDRLIAKYEGQIAKFLSPGGRFLNKHWFWLKWLMWISLIICIICWLIFDTAKQGTQALMSFAGLVFYVLLMLVFSKYPTRVFWRPVFWGLGLQFALGLLILRTTPGYETFNWLGKQMQIFLEYTDTGAKFVFGEKYRDHFFAFKVLPIVVFFSTVISMLYYLEFMQWLIKKIGWLMQATLGSSPIESVVAAGNIFVGQTESPLLVRPYLAHLTKSELHAVMTAGFSTIAGSVLGAYISFGVSPSHLLTASVMSAPASLAVAKLFWPETEIPKITLKNAMKMEKGDSRNLLEAASNGASASVSLVANIAVNMIAFLALLAFVNSALSWLGNMFDYPQMNFEVICSYVFMPFSFMMGVTWQDSFLVGQLIGYKTFFNEFVAFQQLAKMITMRKLGGPKFVDGVQQYLSVRSETIATYALCGFANFGSLGVVIGSLTSLAPSRKRDIAGGALRALIAGTVASFMTACIAGILSHSPMEIDCFSLLEKAFNSTSPSNTTELVTCCQNLFTSTIANNASDILPGSFSTLNGCCLMLNPTTFNCDWVTTSL
ncbi:solute carrier family 28 member 3 [Sarcophilus harrisii]|uniref:Sodium/nucleoside cotransporter n=1 Tax=Sarcophilus harrisii TaxID=9305 RepID=G3WUM9_SARHA|nr:solute carrier family 28 member 3 [Sarcophilus harrisii]XP_031801322.1 solute carrier family 28 member 3 [Sarcophilus harrisii]